MQLKSAIILLDNVFFGVKKFSRESFKFKLEEEHFSNSDATISRLLKFIDEVFGIELHFRKNGTIEIVNDDENHYHLIKSLLLFGKIKNLSKSVVDLNFSFSSDSFFKNSDYIFELYFAIIQSKMIKIYYQKFQSPAAVEMNLKPLLIKEYLGRWYLIAEKENTNIRVYGIDRIKDFKVLNKKFNPNLNVVEIYKNTIGVNYSDRVEKIKLWVEDYQLCLFETFPIHSSQNIISRNKEGGILTLELVNNYELKQLLASFLHKVIIIEPTELKNEMLTFIDAMKNNYQKKL